MTLEALRLEKTGISTPLGALTHVNSVTHILAEYVWRLLRSARDWLTEHVIWD